jgi:hypothetical protein
MANITDGVILISPAMIQQGKRPEDGGLMTIGNAQLKTNLQMDGFGIHL